MITKIAKEMIFGVCLILLWTGTVSARDMSIAEVMKHVTRLESTIGLLEQKHATEIEALEERISHREAEIRNLVKKHGVEINSLKESAELRESDLRANIKTLNERVGSLESRTNVLTEETGTFKTMLTQETLGTLTNEELKESSDVAKREQVSTKTKLRSEDTDTSDQGTAQTKRGTSAYHVAFSAYLDHDADFQGTGQTMVFNRVLLNDGQAYSQYTGIFTAPLDGVYSFTFFIGERDTHQAYVRLYHNSDTTVSAVVQTDNATEDAQGGNTAILELRSGDVIFLRNELSGDHMEGSNVYSTTTFSGFLLYPSQPGGVSVVG